MTFSQQVKKELLKTEYESSCCEKALLYGMCLFGKGFSQFEIYAHSETREIIELYAKLMKKYCNVSSTVNISPKKRSFSVTIDNPADCQKILKTFGHDSAGPLRINHSLFACDNCARAFLAGAFLACGTVSTPEKDYHLEFAVPYLNLSKSLVTLLNEEDLTPKTSVRKGYNIVYFKDSEAIEDCLYIMGAPDSMFEMMNVEIVKNIRNKANRTANCEAANIDKTVKASFVHIEAIEKIKTKKGLDYLKPDLMSIAKLRVDNPEASLSELAALSGLSRSGVNHRLAKLVEISKEL